MLEKEVKVLDINKNEVGKKLLDLWAKKTFQWFIHDIYYDFPGEENLKMEENKRLFRVRQKWETHLYTIKRKRNKKSEWWEKWVKIADEWENEITDVESFKIVLEKYGMKQTREKKKYRTSYFLNGTEFDIDEYEWIPALIEIEAVDKETIDLYIQNLNLSNHIIKKFGSRKLFEYYDKPYLNL